MEHAITRVQTRHKAENRSSLAAVIRVENISSVRRVLLNLFTGLLLALSISLVCSTVAGYWYYQGFAYTSRYGFKLWSVFGLVQLQIARDPNWDQPPERWGPRTINLSSIGGPRPQTL